MIPRVLIVDNNLDFFEDMEDLLKNRGLTSVHAISLETARHLLDVQVFALMICDVRMEDDSNPDDFSGISLIADERYAHIPKVVATAHEDSVRARMVVGRTTYFSGKVDPVRLADLIKICFLELPVNFDLEIRYNKHLPPSLTRLAELLDASIQGEKREYLCQELAYVFGGLFPDESWILLEEVVWHVPGRLAVTVLVARVGQRPRQLLVIVGDKKLLKHERRIFDRYGYSRDGLATLAGQQRFDYGHLAMHTYLIKGTRHQKLCRLADFLHFAALPDTEALLKSLSTQTLANWRQGGSLSVESKDTIPWLQQSKLGGALQALEQHDPFLAQICSSLNKRGFSVAYDGSQLIFGATKKTCGPAPVWEDLKGKALLQEMVLSPGKLNGMTILTDGHDAWLTDFYEAGPVPLVFDPVQLEAMLRFDLGPRDTGPEELFDLEEALVLGPFLDFSCDQAEWQRSCSGIRVLRETADPADVPAYQQIMFCLILQRLWEYDKLEELVPVEGSRIFHLLYALGLLGDLILGHKKQRETLLKYKGLFLDTKKKNLTLEGKEISLPKRQFALFAYLFERRNQPCSREELGQSIWPGFNITERADDNKLTNLIAQLRTRIEEDQGDPKFIQRIQNGYMLVL